jgi:hypothetical protein
VKKLLIANQQTVLQKGDVIVLDNQDDIHIERDGKSLTYFNGVCMDRRVVVGLKSIDDFAGFIAALLGLSVKLDGPKRFKLI